MKKTRSVILIVLMVFVLQAIYPLLFCNVFAANTYTNDLKQTDLIRIYNSKTGFDIKITSNTKIDEVIKNMDSQK